MKYEMAEKLLSNPELLDAFEEAYIKLLEKVEKIEEEQNRMGQKPVNY